MIHSRKLTLATLCLCGALGLRAQQQPGFQAGVSLPVALDGLKTVTGRTLAGACVEGAYQGRYADADVFWRASLALNVFPGQAQEGRSTGLTGLQLGGDVVVPLGSGRLSFITGFSLNHWRQKTSGTDAWIAGASNDNSGNVQKAFGKLGVRVGVEFELAPTWTASVLFQQTELGTNTDFQKVRFETNAKGETIRVGDPDRGRDKINPSWIQVGLRKRF